MFLYFESNTFSSGIEEIRVLAIVKIQISSVAIDLRSFFKQRPVQTNGKSENELIIPIRVPKRLENIHALK